ncbi:ATP-binding cassette domain-containing protein, partial [Hydrogenimonas sp.]|uniref:ATP-binding cassette domain-containing protein n=1 Tax=Hydrogenimonas sp. TaxID=2231112 RepID=UPI002615956D
MLTFDITKSLEGAAGPMELRVALSIVEGSFTAIMGTSGSGKTTLLRILAGLEEATGRIVVDGDFWLKGKNALPPQKRKIGFVFQDYALF